MDLKLSGSSALVTGASRGIGRAVARSLAAEGCGVLLVARDAGTLAASAQAIREESHAPVETIVADLSRPDDVARVGERAEQVDILVNNAGSIPRGSLDDLDDAALHEAWQLKLFGFLGLTRRAYAAMRAAGRGVIANVIGTAGERPTADYVAGSVANAGLIALTRALGAEGPDHGVRVVGVNPGPTLTDRQLVRWRARAAEALGDPDRWPELTSDLAFGRLADVREVADAVTFLCSPRSAYTSGIVVTIDGGRSLKPRP